MSAHTPGPWWFGVTAWVEDNSGDYVERPVCKPVEYSGEGYGGNPYIHGADNTQIVGCDEYDVFGHYDESEHPGRREADIRLMLAAPELLDVTVRARRLLLEICEDASYPIPQTWMDAADAAIAKATQP